MKSWRLSSKEQEEVQLKFIEFDRLLRGGLMKYPCSLTILLGFLFFILLGHAHAATRYVNTTGSDSGNDCTDYLSPCRTIQQALVKCESGDLILVGEGRYKENVSKGIVYTVGTPFTLSIQGGYNSDFSNRRIDPRLTVIDGGSQGAVLSISTSSRPFDFTIENFTLTNGDNLLGGGVYISNGIASANLVMKNIIIKANHAGTGGGFYTRTYKGKTIVELTNTMITGNEGGGIYVEAGYSTYYPETEMTLINDTIAGNHWGSDGAGIHLFSTRSGKATLRIVNTIVWGNTSTYGVDDLFYMEDDTQQDSTTTIEAWYSDIGRKYTPSQYSGTFTDKGGNVSEDPKFKYGNGLRPGSPAIDAGICGTLVFPDLQYVRIAPYDDFEGDMRPGIGSVYGCDIGADEYIAGQAMPWLFLLDD
jgi:hypothetical protein